MPQKLQFFFVYLHKIFFLFAYFYFEYNLRNPEYNKRVNISLQNILVKNY